MNEQNPIELHTFDCIGCGRCVSACRRGVLRLADNGACRFVVIADAGRCAACGHCARSCPRHAIILRQHDTMKKKFGKLGHILGGIALMAALVAATMWLWNALIPEIIGWKSIDYWQALGLLVLTHLVFGHFGRPTRHDERHHMHEMMRGMSHEEKREFIRRKMRNLCDRERQEDGTTAE